MTNAALVRPDALVERRAILGFFPEAFVNGPPQPQRLDVAALLRLQRLENLLRLEQRGDGVRLAALVGGERVLLNQVGVVVAALAQFREVRFREQEVASLARCAERFEQHREGRVVRRGCCRRSRRRPRGRRAQGGLGQLRQEGVDGAVHVVAGGNRLDGSGQLVLEPHRLVVVDAGAEVLVVADDDVPEVEGKLELLLGDHDRGAGLQRMTHAELVDGVLVRRREIRDGDVGLEQVFVHRLVDDAGVHDVVGADALEAGAFDGALDDLVGLVEVEGSVGLVVHLDAETHQYEAPLLRFHVSPVARTMLTRLPQMLVRRMRIVNRPARRFSWFLQGARAC